MCARPRAHLPPPARARRRRGGARRLGQLAAARGRRTRPRPRFAAAARGRLPARGGQRARPHAANGGGVRGPRGVRKPPAGRGRPSQRPLTRVQGDGILFTCYFSTRSRVTARAQVKRYISKRKMVGLCVE